MKVYSQISSSIDDRHGYVLVLALVILTLAALLLTSISRLALDRISLAQEAQLDLQRHWAILSCNGVLLPNAEQFLSQAEIKGKGPVTCVQKSLVLGDERFDLIFGDEQAKANVATLVQRQGKEQAELTIRRLSFTSRVAGTVHLRSTVTPMQPQCFGEVFDSPSPSELCRCDIGIPPAQALSCWGDGRLNIHRASEPIMRETCTGILNLTQIHALVEWQSSAPNLDLSTALKVLQLDGHSLALAQSALTDSSTCHSLWICCYCGRRMYWNLAIADQSQSLTPKVSVWEW